MVHMDMRRVWRSVLDLAHARRDALSPSGRMADKPAGPSLGAGELLSPGICYVA